MSFIAAILLPEQVVMLADRICLMPSGMQFMRKVLEINTTSFLGMCGFVDACDEIFNLIKEEFGDGSVLLPKLERMQKKFEERVGKILEEPYEPTAGVSAVSHNVNCALAGFDVMRSPYLVNLSMLRDRQGNLAPFEIRICRQPGENLMLSPWSGHEPLNTLNKNIDLIHAFLNEHFNSPIPIQREALRETFKKMMENNVLETCFITPLYDVLFVDRQGSTLEEGFCGQESSNRWEKAATEYEKQRSEGISHIGSAQDNTWHEIILK